MKKDEQPRPKRGLNQELQTMARIDRLLSELDCEAVDRVLAWLQSKYATPPVETFDPCR